MAKGNQHLIAIDTKTDKQINAQTGTETDEKRHKNNMFSDVWKHENPLHKQCLF